MKKTLLLALAAIMLLSSVAFAQGKAPEQTAVELEKGYLKMNGTIAKITDEDGYKAIELKNREGNVDYILRVGDTPVIIDTKDGSLKDHNFLKENMEISVFYDVKTPVMQSYPAQFTPDVIAVDSADGYNIDVDYYNEDLEGAQHRLAVVGYDAKEVYNLDGTKSEDGNFENKELIVLYRESTKSIPAQTKANKIYHIESANEYKDGAKYARALAKITKIENVKGHVSVTAKTLNEDANYDIVANITNKTAVFSNKLYAQIAPQDLKVGDKIEVYYDANISYKDENPFIVAPAVVVLNENEAEVHTVFATSHDDFRLQGTGLQLAKYEHTNVTFADGKNGFMDDVKGKLVLVFFEEVFKDESSTKIKPTQITIMELKGNKYKIMLGETEIGYDTKAIEKDGGKTLYPVREIFENANGEVNWNADTEVITIHLEPDVIKIDTKANTFTKNDDAAKPLVIEIIEGTTFASEALFK